MNTPYISVGADATRLAVWPPVQCRCGRMTAFWINRDGRSRCIECDAEYRQAGKEPKEKA